MNKPSFNVCSFPSFLYSRRFRNEVIDVVIIMRFPINESPPPLWGRDRVGGTSARLHKAQSPLIGSRHSTPHLDPPPQGGRRPEVRTTSVPLAGRSKWHEFTLSIAPRSNRCFHQPTPSLPDLIHRHRGPGIDRRADQEARQDRCAALLDRAHRLAAGAHRVDESLEREQRVVGLGAAALLVGLFQVGAIREGAGVEVDARPWYRSVAYTPR